MYIKLAKKELEQLKALSLQLTIDPNEYPDLYCQKAKELSAMVPTRIINLLTSFAENGSTSGFLLFRDLYFDDILPDTPIDNTQNIGSKTLFACIQSILLSIIADPLAYEAECNGSLFQDVVPISETERIQTSTSSKTELEIHTEQAFSPLKPDILSLACIRGDPNALTHILTLNTIFEYISLDDLELLFRPLWLIGVDYSFKKNKEVFLAGNIRGPMSILSGSILDPKLVFDQDLMTGLTDKAKYMMEKIIKIYYEHRYSYNLQKGEIIFIDNNRAVHGRSSFSPKYDKNDRFLIRCFGVFDIEKSSYARTDIKNSRKILSIYS